MAPEQRDKIFLPFFTTKPTGTGLGMAIVKKIMDLHNGEIEIDSLPGGGTAVRLVIPARCRRCRHPPADVRGGLGVLSCGAPMSKGGGLHEASATAR
jgi:hypothetical protein